MTLDHEKLDIYRAAIELIAWVGDRLESSAELRKLPAAKHLDEASQSIANNIAEGKRSLADRVRYLDIARGSALECAACPGALVARKRLTAPEAAVGKQTIERIVSMLWKMIVAIQPTLPSTSASTAPRTMTSTSTSTRRSPESPMRGR